MIPFTLLPMELSILAKIYDPAKTFIIPANLSKSGGARELVGRRKRSFILFKRSNLHTISQESEENELPIK